MKLKKEANIIEFFNCVKDCNGDVYLHIPNGEQLNLKSTLSQYIISVLNDESGIVYKGTVHCIEKTDYNRLLEFLDE